MDSCLGARAAGEVAADRGQVVPAAVALQDPAGPGGFGGVEPGLQPGLEAGQVAVAVRQQTVVDKKIAEVPERGSAIRSVEGLVGQVDAAVAEPGEQRSDGGASFPGVDRLRPIDADEELEERCERRVRRAGGGEQDGEVIA